MPSKEFEAFKRCIAKSAVEFINGKISGKELYANLYVTLGQETFEETEKLLELVKSKTAE